MKSIERRFNAMTAKYPNHSSYLCFAKAVDGQEFSKQAIHRWFNQLVDKEDYVRKEKKAILAHLCALSNPVRTTRNEA